MKKRVIAAALLLCMFLAGCSARSDNTSVTFYYPRENYTQNAEDSVLKAEQRSDLPYKSYFNILSVYLDGPMDILLQNPFPEDLELVDVFITGRSVVVIFNDQLAKLSGVQLSLTCCSIAKTAMELTGTDSCQIRCRAAAFDGKTTIQLTQESILLLDEIPVETNQNTEE